VLEDCLQWDPKKRITAKDALVRLEAKY